MSRDGALVAELYEPRVAGARDALASGPAVSRILDPRTPPEALELYFVHFCAQGVGMTEPVDGWIRRAGGRCREIGLEDLGRALQQHAKHEAGHHLMLIDDTRGLAGRWNDRRTPRLDADALLAAAPTGGVAAYRALHEDVIAGPAPYGQLAIEYEIEGLSVRLGPSVIARCRDALGEDFTRGLGFIHEHVLLDVAHTRFNESQLDRLLAEHPAFAPALAEAGSRALDAYARFMSDCWALTDALLG